MREQPRRLPQAHAADVDDVNRRAGRGDVGEHFLERVDAAARLDFTRRAHVDERQRLAPGRELEHAEQLVAAGGRGIGRAHADAERARRRARARAARSSRRLQPAPPCETPNPALACDASCRVVRISSQVDFSCITAMRE